jgi:uncharacterized protein
MSAKPFALVTGASSGIGESFARALAAREYNLVLVARSLDKLMALAEELRTRHGVDARAVDFDLSLPDAAQLLHSRLRQDTLPIQLLINNAGFGGRGEFWNLPLDRQIEMFRLNVQTVVELTHLLLPSLLESRKGGIVNVSSITGFQPVPFAALYAATKAFVTSFSMALAEELRPYGIPVVTLCPGGTRTHFVEIGKRGKAKFPGGPQDPAEVASLALDTLNRGGGLVVPRLINRATLWPQRLLPRTLIPRLIGRYSRP